MSEIKPTEEQEAIIRATRESRDSIMIQALAGAAKTTTLVMASREVKVPALALAFNKSIKEELGKRLPANFKTMTMNGLGFAAFLRANPSLTVKLEDKKLGRLVTATLKDFKTEMDGEQWDLLRSLVSKAMGRGLLPAAFGEGLLPDSLEGWGEVGEELGIPPDDLEMYMELGREVLRKDIELAFAGQLSFDDQVYVSTLISGKFPLFPLMMIDEAQDLSELNHAMLAKCVRPDGRLIVCGDQLQSVYAFRGADHESMSKLRRLRPKWIDLPLTTTFRCPEVVVKRQLWHAPAFKAAPQAPKGAFFKLPNRVGESWLDQEEPQTWSWSDLTTLRPSPTAELAILCRNNAPLLSLAFKLLRERVPVRFLGREIGQGLIALSKKLAPDDATLRLDFAALLKEWEERETSLAVANGKEEKVDGIEDKAECLRAVLSYESVNTAGDLRRELKSLFSRDDGVTLATIHKAKGLEWDMVVLLDPWRMPSKWAKAAAQKGDDRALRQENNLRYVAETRSKNVLVHASMSDFESLDGRGESSWVPSKEAS